MAVENNFIFRVEWTGNHTKWDYRLDIIIPPEGYPDGLDLADPGIWHLPIYAIIPQKANINYPDYFGTPEIPTLDLNIDLRAIPEVLVKALTTPGLIYASITNPVEAGVVFQLYIKYNGNDTITPPNYRLFKSYIHYADGSFKYKPTDAFINVQAIDLNFATLRALTLKGVEMYNLPRITKMNILEIYTIIDTNLYTHYFGGGPFTVDFVSLSSLFDKITLIARNIYRLLLRDSTASFVLQFATPDLYKQTDALSGAEGVKIDYLNLYVLAYINYNGVAIGGLFDANDPQSLWQTYPNSVADFYSEWAEFNLRQIKSGDLGLNMDADNFTNLNIDINKIYDLSFSINDEKVKSVTASLYENNTDTDTGGDINKSEAAISGSRNEASWTLPIVFNNILTNVKRIEDRYPDGARWYRGNATLLKNLYYLDIPSFDTIERAIRVHEYANFDIQYYEFNNPTSADLVPKTLISRGDAANPPIIALGTQTASGIPYILSNYALQLLKGGMDTMECMVDMNYLVYHAGGGAYGNPWQLDNYNEYLFHLTNYDPTDPFMADLAQNWKLVASEFDFLAETIKVKFIRLKINQIT